MRPFTYLFKVCAGHSSCAFNQSDHLSVSMYNLIFHFPVPFLGLSAEAAYTYIRLYLPYGTSCICPCFFVLQGAQSNTLAFWKNYRDICSNLEGIWFPEGTQILSRISEILLELLCLFLPLCWSIQAHHSLLACASLPHNFSGIVCYALPSTDGKVSSDFLDLGPPSLWWTVIFYNILSYISVYK